MRILLPLALVFTVVLMSQGVVQNLKRRHDRHRRSTRRPQITEQHIPGGPFASQEAIKQLGTNGGGPYNANSAHPFENPNGFTDLLEIFALLLIPFVVGRDVRDASSRTSARHAC